MNTQDKLLQMLHSESFEELADFTKPASWTKMSLEEKELLSILFIKQAEKQIDKGDKEVFQSCEMATMLAPENPYMHFHKGLVFARQRENMRCLMAASQALQECLAIDPTITIGWVTWANVLCDMGHLSEDIECFYDASAKYKTALELADNPKSPVHAYAYWHWGACLHFIGNAAGEPNEYHEALKRFLMAEQMGVDYPLFYNDFGDLYSSLSNLLPFMDYDAKAILCYRNATIKDPAYYNAWLSLGCTLTLQYQNTKDEGDFLDAHHAFERCIEIDSSEPGAWVRWGHLLACGGKSTQDIDRVYASFEKFEAASLLDSEMPRLLLHWGDALLMVGVHEERIDLLKAAEAKITRAMRSLSNVEEAWVIYAKCLCDLGNYFHDAQYYRQAIEKYEHALKQFPNCPGLVSSLAHALVALGDLTSSPYHYDLAIRAFENDQSNAKKYSCSDYNEWGIAWLKMAEFTMKGEHAAASVEKFEQAITIGLETMTFNELDPAIIYNYGASIDFLGDFHNDVTYYDKAAQMLAHVVAVDETHPFAKYNLALALFHRGELAHDLDSIHKAMEILEELVHADPEDDVLWGQYGMILMTLAEISSAHESNDTSAAMFADAESKLKRAIAYGSTVAHYNIACLYSLTSNKPGAMRHLEIAEKQNALPLVDEILEEEWLDSLHDMPEFRALIARQYEEDDEKPKT